MKVAKKTMAFLLTGIIGASLFSGCKKDETVNKSTDLCIVSEKEADTLLMAVGDETVTLEEASIYAYFLKRQYEGSVGTVIWDYNLEGEKFGSYAKSQIQNHLTQIKILKQEAVKRNIALTDDEKEEAVSYAEDYMKYVSKEDAECFGVTKEKLALIYEENILANKVFDISTNNVDTNISDNEAKQITIQYLHVMTKGTNKNEILVDMTKEEKKEARSRAKKLFAEAKKSPNFLIFAESNTDAKEAELTFSKADAPEALKDISFELNSGEFSSLIKGDDGYYIVYCVSDDDEDATAKRKEEIIRERQMKSFEKQFAKWSAEYEITVSDALWSKMSF